MISKISACLILTLTLSACSPDSSFKITPLSQNHIIGGDIATQDSAVAASTVAIVTAKNSVLKENCTGTVISEDLILTAAHCLENKHRNNLWIYIGAKLPSPYYLDQLLKIRRFISHSDFKAVSPDNFPETELNDIALIQLENKLPTAIKPVAIQVGVSPQLKDKLLLAGYGIINDNTKQRTTHLRTATASVSRIWDKIIVLDQRHGSGACLGDSGGPAYISKDDQLILVGVTRGAHDGSSRCNNFVEYTNATRFEEFITHASNELEATPPTFYRPSVSK